MNVKFKEIQPGMSEVLDAETGEVLGIMYPAVKCPKYTKMLADVICDRIMNGEKMSSIVSEMHMPSMATIRKWKREHEEFYENLMEAKNERAEYFFEKVLDVVDAVDEDSVGSSKVKIDGYKYAAQVSNPGEYSPRAKVDAIISAPLQIIIDTGIRRESDVIMAKDVTPSLEEAIVSTKGTEAASSNTANSVGDEHTSKTNDH